MSLSGRLGLYFLAVCGLGVSFLRAHQPSMYRVLLVPYHRVPDYKGDTVSLYAQLYVPTEGKSRPVLILVHGGGFEGGTRECAFLVHFAKYFAERGFVVASIDYRVGLPAEWSAQDWLLANLRAVQDLRTFIRYLKHSVGEGNPYGIDTTHIVVAGWSAGAFTVLQGAFLTDWEDIKKLPHIDTQQVAAIGGLYGDAYPGHTSDFWMAVSLSGGLYELSWITPKKVSHLVTIHPKADRVVRYDSQVGHRGIFWYGGYTVDSIARQRGISTFHLTVDMPFCRQAGVDCHYWQGDEKHVALGTPIIEAYLEEVLSALLVGGSPLFPLRRKEIRPAQGELLRGCLKGVCDGLRDDSSVRGYCTAWYAAQREDRLFFLLGAGVVLYLSVQVYLAFLIRRTPISDLELQIGSVPVLVAVRDEAEALPGFLQCLKTQDLPCTIYWGEDGSSDSTLCILESAQQERPQDKLFRVPSELHQRYPGKHAVLVHLEKEVNADLFLVADADMRFPSSWAKVLCGFLEKRLEMGGCCAPSLPSEKTIWEAFQRVEWASTLYLIAANQQRGRVVTAIGNSLALRRVAWVTVGGWRSLPPTLVEDYELLRGIERVGWCFEWVFHPAVLGETRAEPTLRRWLHQRLRWRKAARDLPRESLFYWVLQSLIPWTLLVGGNLFLLGLWAVAEGIPLARFRWVVGARRILRYVPLLLLYRFIQGPWLVWLRFARLPLYWRGRMYSA
ncbi:MAG: carboxylesterase family protein [Bacteroidia bacterium]|nr:carboxylesterase family protein [Bacteroidia bacterium]